MTDRVLAPPLGVERLASYLSRTLNSRSGKQPAAATPTDWMLDCTLISGLGLNLKETLSYVFNEAPSLEAFERWILEKNGGAIERERITRLNAAMTGNLERTAPVSEEPVLDSAALTSFEENGYVVLHDAVPASQCVAAEAAIWEYLRLDPADPSSWRASPLGASIWVPLIHHPALDANRHAPRVRRAFEQLWGRSDLWPVIDQTGFNPPERADWSFPGPDLHWDVSLTPPVPFGLQGVLSVTDTAADQGAFTCVPGFHRGLDAWVASLPPGADARRQDLRSLGAVPVPGRAGDLVIWHQGLPHGSSPNHATRPRIVQYLTLRPTVWEEHAEWR